MQRLWLIAASFVVASCHSGVGVVGSVKDIGTVPNPPLVSARDVGFSTVLGQRSVWVFGDTLFSEPAADGFQWRSSSWSWTTPDGLGAFHHALGEDGKPLQLLPHTPAEDAFNTAHRSDNRRHTLWPQALVSDGHRAIVFYVNMVTGPNGAFDFASASGSVAVWADPDRPASRVEPPLFANEEPDWGAAAVMVDNEVYVYACNEVSDKPCKLARVAFESATDRASYSFYTGQSWSRDWHDAAVVFDGAPQFSVYKSPYLGRYVAIYMKPAASEMRFRTAPAPEGPWSDETTFGEGLAPHDIGFDYALVAHPELAREGGAVEILSYTHPTGPLRQETRLVELRWR